MKISYDFCRERGPGTYSRPLVLSGTMVGIERAVRANLLADEDEPQDPSAQAVLKDLLGRWKAQKIQDIYQSVDATALAFLARLALLQLWQADYIAFPFPLHAQQQQRTPVQYATVMLTQAEGAASQLDQILAAHDKAIEDITEANTWDEIETIFMLLDQEV